MTSLPTLSIPSTSAMSRNAFWRDRDARARSISAALDRSSDSMMASLRYASHLLLHLGHGSRRAGAILSGHRPPSIARLRSPATFVDASEHPGEPSPLRQPLISVRRPTSDSADSAETGPLQEGSPLGIQAVCIGCALGVK